MINLDHLQGKFITFEGGEGSGKSILSNRLYEDFQRQHIPVVKTHDPGGTGCAQDIRKILLSKYSKVGKYAEMLLYSAARAQLTDEIIKPALKRGATVICDRWFDSTLVYQGVLRKQDPSILRTIFDYTCGVVPNITFLLNVDAETGLKRSYQVLNDENVDESKFEDYGLVFHKKINKAFLDLAHEEYLYPPNDYLNRIRIINANKSFEDCYDSMNNFLAEIKK